MSGATYQVKLYGHTSDDVESFCKKLAAVLEMEETAAMILLHDVPVVVRANLTKAAAENLSGLLTSIRALSIAEPMDGLAVETKPRVPESVAEDVLRASGTPYEGRDAQARVWMLLGLGLAGFLIVSVVIGVAVTYVNLYSEPASATGNHSPQDDAGEKNAGRVDEGALADLQLKVDNLQREYDELRNERDAAHNDLSVADDRLVVPGEMQVRRDRLRSVQTDMRAVLKELVEARLQLDRMKKRSGRKTTE